MGRMRRELALLPGMAAVVLASATCADNRSARPDVQAEWAWARAVADSAGTTAAYMVLRNVGDAPGRLVGLRSEAARDVQLHRTTIDDSGLARMTEIDALDIPAGGSVVLEPGGYHLMLVGAGPLAAGDTVRITLDLEGSAPVEIEAEVRAF